MSRKFKLPLYALYRISILVCTCVMLGFFLIFPTEIIGGYTSRFIVAIYGCILALSTISIKNRSYRQLQKRLNSIIGVYIICVLIAVVNTQMMYHYSVYEISVSVMPFLYIFYAYPILYLFFKDNGIEKTISSVTKCVLVFLVLKGISWLLYTFTGRIFFSQLLFEYGSTWIRNGNQRVNAGYLVGIALAFCVIKGFSGKKSNLYKFFTVYIILFLWFATAFRFQFIVAVVTVIAGVFFSDTSKRTRRTNRIAIAIIGITALFSPFVSDLIDSFSIENATLGTSTSLRLLTIEHFGSLMIHNNPILGLGLMISENPLAQSLLRKSQWRLFYLEDIGFLGAWFKLGFLTLGIYGKFFYWGIKDILVKKSIPQVSRMFMISVIVYMVFSCLMLNIFDLQRAYDVPFYVALICFYHNAILKKYNTDKIIVFQLHKG